ncbi:MAG: amino acid ABC transporter permease [Alphaproteobacteria bacterium]
MGNWERLVWNQRDVLFAGFAVTIEVCAIAFLAAIAGGLALCLIRLYVAPLRWVALVLIEFFRDTPIFVQLMWVAYVWPEVFGFPNDFFTAGWLALALQSSGYLAETFRAGIEGVPRGQREAAFSAGMSPVQTFRRVVMPQVALSSAPSIVNQFTVIVKSSTLISVITVPDLMSQSQKLVNVWYEPIEILTATAALYIGFVFLISLAGKLIADRLRRRFGLAAS